MFPEEIQSSFKISVRECIVELLKQLDWKSVASQHNHLVFQHTPTGIRMHDVHSGNFILQKNGILIPIDVFFEGLADSFT